MVFPARAGSNGTPGPPKGGWIMSLATILEVALAAGIALVIGIILLQVLASKLEAKANSRPETFSQLQDCSSCLHGVHIRQRAPSRTYPDDLGPYKVTVDLLDDGQKKLIEQQVNLLKANRFVESLHEILDKWVSSYSSLQIPDGRHYMEFATDSSRPHFGGKFFYERHGWPTKPGNHKKIVIKLGEKLYFLEMTSGFVGKFEDSPSFRVLGICCDGEVVFLGHYYDDRGDRTEKYTEIRVSKLTDDVIMSFKRLATLTAFAESVQRAKSAKRYKRQRKLELEIKKKEQLSAFQR
ncbi:hypothetical protein P3C58_08690 [Mesorhizobium sp. XAP10]|uniref:hypothetical protein n=1 Tax=unclassified Mesorhizobium TaxID=325217 RepID=UPI0023DEC62C|nr:MULTISPECIES: hypothetical protein [unclassified Mesorhizobium]MDF3152052.1 hypothetical protein [Mesorhizobium sp. XAP10]MDF3244938.1 hypothetical protein [Mesorhizobium sp. XAP4]